MEIVATGFGDANKLRYVGTPFRPPSRGEIALEVPAAGVNHVDHRICAYCSHIAAYGNPRNIVSLAARQKVPQG